MSRSPAPAPPAEGPMAPEAVEAELVQAFKDFFRLYAERGEGVVDALRERMSPTVTGFGAGGDERFTGREAMVRIFLEELEQQPDPLAIAFLWTEARLLAPSVGVAEAEVVFTVATDDGESVSFDIRLSVVLRHEDGAWRVAHNHGSMPAHGQAEGERLPLDALKARNQELERLVAERTADLRAAQAQLVHQEKMASLGALTAGIAHEIKNPLNFVTNFAGLSVDLADELREALVEGDRGAAEEVLDDLAGNAAKIAEHGARADAIVSSMMRHAQGGTGRRQTVDLNGLVAEYAAHATHALAARDPDADLDLDLRLGDDVGEVEAVPQEIGRVLVALLDNAFDAVRERPGAGRVTVTTARADGGIEVRVADDGPGIAADALGRVFEPFYTTKPTGQGHTGLGLSLAHDAVVQGHGGTLTVESEPGHGATFVLALPAPDPIPPAS